MKLLPKDPTPEMLHALMDEWDSTGKRSMLDNYRAMYDAAPEVTGEPVGYTQPIAWRKRDSEQVIKLTKLPQEKYGYVNPIYTHPQPDAAELVEALNEVLKVCESTPVKTYQMMEEIARAALAKWEGVA